MNSDDLEKEKRKAQFDKIAKAFSSSEEGKRLLRDSQRPFLQAFRRMAKEAEADARGVPYMTDRILLDGDGLPMKAEVSERATAIKNSLGKPWQSQAAWHEYRSQVRGSAPVWAYGIGDGRWKTGKTLTSTDSEMPCIFARVWRQSLAGDVYYFDLETAPLQAEPLKLPVMLRGMSEDQKREVWCCFQSSDARRKWFGIRRASQEKALWAVEAIMRMWFQFSNDSKPIRREEAQRAALWAMDNLDVRDYRQRVLGCIDYIGLESVELDAKAFSSPEAARGWEERRAGLSEKEREALAFGGWVDTWQDEPQEDQRRKKEPQGDATGRVYQVFTEVEFKRLQPRRGDVVRMIYAGQPEMLALCVRDGRRPVYQFWVDLAESTYKELAQESECQPEAQPEAPRRLTFDEGMI